LIRSIKWRILNPESCKSVVLQPKKLLTKCSWFGFHWAELPFFITKDKRIYGLMQSIISVLYTTKIVLCYAKCLVFSKQKKTPGSWLCSEDFTLDLCSLLLCTWLHSFIRLENKIQDMQNTRFCFLPVLFHVLTLKVSSVFH